jgi:hypothetical protein
MSLSVYLGIGEGFLLPHETVVEQAIPQALHFQLQEEGRISSSKASEVADEILKNTFYIAISGDNPSNFYLGSNLRYRVRLEDAKTVLNQVMQAKVNFLGRTSLLFLRDVSNTLDQLHSLEVLSEKELQDYKCFFVEMQ